MSLPARFFRSSSSFANLTTKFKASQRVKANLASYLGVHLWYVPSEIAMENFGQQTVFMLLRPPPSFGRCTRPIHHYPLNSKWYLHHLLTIYKAVSRV